MRMIAMFEPFTRGPMQGVEQVLVPEDDVIARSILVSSRYLLRMEELVLTEKNPGELVFLQKSIPNQKEHILELWERIEDPSRVPVLAGKHEAMVGEVKLRLLKELETNGPFVQPVEGQDEVEEVSEER
jgi:hypothetical protein